MKKLILFAALAVLASCSSGDDNPNNEQNNNNQIPITEIKGKIKSTEYTYYVTDQNGGKTPYKSIAEYSYGSNGYISNAKITDTYDNSISYQYYDYNENNIEKWRYQMSGKNYESAYTYNGNLILKSTNNEEGGLHIRNFEYNSKNEKVKETYFTNTTSLSSITDYSYINGNISKEVTNYKSNGAPTEPITTTYSYDNKNIAFKGAFPENYLMMIGIGKNNVIKDDNDVFTYEYNSDNFPTKRIAEDEIIVYKYY